MTDRNEGTRRPRTSPDLLRALQHDQRQRWERGERPTVETYLEQHPGLRDDPEALLDLIYPEFRLRQLAGEAPTLAEYADRFPEVADDLRDQLEVDAAVRAEPEPTLTSLPASAPTETLTAPVPARSAGGWPFVPGYEILGELGRGGMGVVYQARHLRLGRMVALKMIQAAELAGPEERGRLQTEAEALARLQHPNIVQVFEIGEHAGAPFLALEYCPGGSLAAQLRGTPLPPAEAAALVETLARAVQAAHEAGVVHRDLKPANVLLTFSRDAERSASASLRSASRLNEGDVKLTDFGLAKRLDAQGQTVSGAIMGTPEYMAPEQAAGRPQDTGPHTDVYALGAVLYELLTGTPPFRTPTAWGTISRVLVDDPVPPSRLQPGTPRDLEAICLKCLEKDAARRYASAAALADDVRRFRGGEPTVARPAGPLRRLAKWARRRPAVAALLAVSAAAAVALLGLSGALWRSAELRAQAFKDYTLAQQAIRAATAEVNRLDKVARLTAYAIDLREAQAAVNDANFTLLRERLDAHLPRPGREDLRGFEWRYWDRVYHAERRSFPGQGFVAFAPDGEHLVTAGPGHTLRRVHVGTGAEAGRFAGLKARPVAAAFSPDRDRLAAVSADGKVAFWDTKSAKLLRLLDAHQGSDLHVAAGAGGRFATCDGRGGIKLWRDTPDREEFSLSGHEGAVFATAFSRDGKTLVSAGADATARLWDLDKRTATVLKGVGAVTAVAFSPDGSLLAVARLGPQRTIELYRLDDWERTDLHGHTQAVNGLSFSADGDLLASAGLEGTIRLWHTRTGTPRLPPLPGHRQEVVGLAFSPGDAFAGHLASVGREGTVKVWDVSAPHPERRTLTGHSAAVKVIAFSPDGNTLASGGHDRTVCVWDLGTGALRFDPLNHTAWVTTVGFSADGKRLLAASRDPLADGGDVRAWDADTGKGRPPLVLPAGPAAVGPGRLAVVGKDGKVRLFDDAGRELATLPGHAGGVTALAWAAAGERLATAGADRLVKVWDVPAGRLAAELPVAADKVERLALSATGDRLAWAGPDHSIRVWTVGATGAPVEMAGHEGPVHGLAFSPDGGRLASAGHDRTVRLWDTFAGRELLRLRLPWSQVWSVAFSADGRRLAAGGGGRRGEVQVWDVGRSK